MYYLWQYISVGIIIFDLDLHTWPTFRKLQPRLITLDSYHLELSNFVCVFLMTISFYWYHNFWPSDLDLRSWLLFKNFNQDFNVLILGDRASIHCICISFVFLATKILIVAAGEPCSLSDNSCSFCICTSFPGQNSHWYWSWENFSSCMLTHESRISTVPGESGASSFP